jgi:hypothetical protein
MAAPLKYVSAESLRDRFNGGRYRERLEQGEFKPDITMIGPAPARFPATTQSQIVGYRDAAGRTVAIVHQYADQWGNPAAGTEPDPKFLFDKGVRYKVSRLV